MLSSLGVSEHTCKARFRVFELCFSSILSDETLSSVEQARVILIPHSLDISFVDARTTYFYQACVCVTTDSLLLDCLFTFINIYRQ